MNKAVYRITLDMSMIESQYQIPIKKHDTARSIHMDLANCGEHYRIEDGCRAVVMFRDAEDQPFLTDCVIRHPGSIVEFDIPETMTDNTGLIDCELRVYGYDDQILTSPRFTVLVSDVVYDDGGSHGFTIASIFGLQEELDDKLPKADVIDPATAYTEGYAADALYVNRIDQHLYDVEKSIPILIDQKIKDLNKGIEDYITFIKDAQRALEGSYWEEDVDHSAGSSYSAGYIEFSGRRRMTVKSTGSIQSLVKRVERLEDIVLV